MTEFIKMQSVGNDYVFVDGRKISLADPSALSRLVSKRRFSVGGDGLVVIEKSAVADAKMRMFNADGSEGLMCGNALRCVGRILVGRRRRGSFIVETASGLKRVSVDGNYVKAELGRADFSSAACSFEGGADGENFIEFDGRKITFVPVSVGNPHAVAFVDGFGFDAESAAAKIAEKFKSGANVEFAVAGNGGAKVRVIERGSGETFGCGTGAAAVAAAMRRRGYDKDECKICFRGGELVVKFDGEILTLCGQVKLVARGKFYE